MAVARYVPQYPARYVAVAPANVTSSGSTPFNPDSIATILQNLGSPLTYADSPLGTIPVLESSIGEVGTPRGQACVQFDGSNDYLISDSAGSFSPATTFTIAAMVCFQTLPGMGRKTIVQNIQAFNDFEFGIAVSSVTANRLCIVAGKAGVASQEIAHGTDIVADTWYSVVGVYDGTDMHLYINGVLSSSVALNATTLSATANTKGLSFGVTRYDNTSYYACALKSNDARIYSVAKSDAEILAIYNQHLAPDTVDITNALGIWPLQEESGTVCYNIVDPTKNLTATNVDTSAFRTTDSGVKYSFPNQFGYTDDAGVIIPADLDNPTLDCEGDALETPGPIWLPGVMEVPCVTLDGLGTDYITLASDLNIGTVHTISVKAKISGDSMFFGRGAPTDYGIFLYQGDFYYRASSVTVSVSHVAGDEWTTYSVVRNGTSVKFFVDGVQIGTTQTLGGNPDCIVRSIALSIGYNAFLISESSIHTSEKSDAEILAISQGYDDRIDLLAHWGCQDGPGTNNDNRTIHDNSGNGHHLTATNGTVSTQWANRTTVVKDQCIVAGGGIAANGSFVPGIPGSANDAAGNVKTLAVGKRGNPYSKLLRNYFSAPALVNIGCTSSDKEAPGYDVQSESVANTRFRRTAADGDDRDLSFSEAQAGENLDNVEEWVS